MPTSPAASAAVPVTPEGTPSIQSTLVLDSRAQAVDLVSPALALCKRFYIYTPPHYGATTDRLPVVYLFRGHEREWINAHEDPSRQGKTVIDVYEELLAQESVGPMLLVFPGISSDDNQWSGMLTNGRAANLPWVKGKLGSGRWEDYFLNDLMPYVDSCYRTNPQARAVDGFSLGGFMAVKIAAQHPGRFQSVGAYDGLYFWDNPRDPQTIAHSDRVFTRSLFAPVYGDPPDPAFGAANNPLNLVRTAEPDALRRLQWLIEYGPESAEPNDSNYYRGSHLQELLAQRGIKNVGGPIPHAHHTWAEADAHMRRTFPLHWQRLHAQL
ncbi:MAG: esterase [Herpetosiphonaceae bacterium]|nr:esterase [Herpetosiphonaceae bacterium]